MFAFVLLVLLFQFKGAPVIRSRDPKVLDQCTIIVDVGGIYNPETLRFDHHQRGFFRTFEGPMGPEEEDETAEDKGIKLSSAGLIYKHYGREVIENLLGLSREADASVVETVFKRVYTNFVAAIDAIDNGVDQYPKSAGQQRYKVTTDLGSRVGRLNPGWNETDIDIDSRFADAMALTGAEFSSAVHFWGKVWLPAREIVSNSIDGRQKVDPSGEIVVLQQMCPWKEHFRELEAEKGVVPLVKYVLFTDQSGAWRVQCVSKSEGSFENRKDLLWKGLRDDALSKESGMYVFFPVFSRRKKVAHSAFVFGSCFLAVFWLFCFCFPLK
jgi:MYG1 exonuclease